MIKTKKCTICKERKDFTLEFFVPSKNAKDGLRNQCKVCKNNRQNKYRGEDPQHRRDIDKENYKKKQKHYAEYRKKYYAENTDKSKHKNQRKKELLTKSYVANTMRIRVEDMPESLYVTKKLNILLKREINK